MVNKSGNYTLQSISTHVRSSQKCFMDNVRVPFVSFVAIRVAGGFFFRGVAC